MAKKKNPESLYDYNIYKIKPEKAAEFKDSLEKSEFKEKSLNPETIKNSAGYKFTLMFCDKDNQKGSSWINLLSTCTREKINQQLKIYGAVLICFKEDSCFIVSYGNAHFYMNEYCDFNFGVDVAERLINLDKVKAQQNVSHGNYLNKMHMDYIANTSLTYRSGEIPTFIRGESVDQELWGSKISCGISAQFKWPEKPTEIGKKLDLLNKELQKESKTTIPKLVILKEAQDKDIISKLYYYLASAIEDYSDKRNKISVPSFYLLGTKLMQNDSGKFKLSYNRKKQEFENELSLDAVNEFVKENDLDLKEVIKDIKIAFEYDDGSKWGKSSPLTTCMEFIIQDKYCLRNGKWCSFNNKFIDYIHEVANKIEFKNHINDEFSLSAEDVIKKAKDDGYYNKPVNKEPYETYYNIAVSKQISATCVHPQTVPVSKENKQTRYEICDFYKENTLYFVKIGELKDFAYAINQAGTTLKMCNESNGQLNTSNNSIITPAEFRLVLIFKKCLNKVNTWKDLNSINFLISLTELKNNLNIAGLSLGVDFVYWNQSATLEKVKY